MTVVNGLSSMVGSDKNGVRSAINAGLDRDVTVGLTLWSLVEADEDSLLVDYEVLDPPEKTELHIVLVESELVTEPQRGENRGETLEHTNVVRSWVTLPDWAGVADVPIPSDAVREHCQLFAFVQHKRTMEVLGATSLSPFSPE